MASIIFNFRIVDAFVITVKKKKVEKINKNKVRVKNGPMTKLSNLFSLLLSQRRTLWRTRRRGPINIKSQVRRDCSVRKTINKIPILLLLLLLPVLPLLSRIIILIIIWRFRGNGIKSEESILNKIGQIPKGFKSSTGRSVGRSAVAGIPVILRREKR